MGTAAPAALREVSRAARTALLSDRAGPVRAAAAHALRHMLPLIRLTPADLDTIAAACLRAALQSDYTLRYGSYLIQLLTTFLFNFMYIPTCYTYLYDLGQTPHLPKTLSTTLLYI